MSSVLTKSAEVDKEGEPAWEIARLFPNQGFWSEEDYLALDGNHLVEFSDGYVEVLPMPTTSHQRIVLFLYEMLRLFIFPGKLGEVLVGRESIVNPISALCGSKTPAALATSFGREPISSWRL